MSHTHVTMAVSTLGAAENAGGGGGGESGQAKDRVTLQRGVLQPFEATCPQPLRGVPAQDS